MKKLILMVMGLLMLSTFAHADIGKGYYLLQCEHKIKNPETGKVDFTFRATALTLSTRASSQVFLP